MMPPRRAKGKNHEFRLRRRYDATVKDLYDAWTQPRLMKLWWPPAGYQLMKSKAQVKAGGPYRFDLKGPGGLVIVSGVYHEVVPRQKLVYSWTLQGSQVDVENALITVHFKRLKGGAEILFHQRFLPTLKACTEHRRSWGASMTALTQMNA